MSVIAYPHALYCTASLLSFNVDRIYLDNFNYILESEVKIKMH